MLYIRLVRKTIIINIMTFFPPPNQRKTESTATLLYVGPPAGTTIYGDWMQNPILQLKIMKACIY